MPSEPTLPAVREHLEVIRQDAGARRQLLIDLDSSVRTLRREWQSRLPAATSEIERTNQKRRQRRRAQIERNTAQAKDSAHTLALSLSAELAPGILCAEPQSGTWDAPTQSVQLGSHVRVGALTADPRVPVVLPLLGTAGWSVRAGPAGFTGLVHSLALRLLFAVGPRNLQITVFDPDFSCDFGLFADVKRVSRETLPTALSACDDLDAALEALLSGLRSTDEALSAEGHESYLAAYTVTGALTHPVRLLVLAGKLDGLSERGRSRLAQLIKVGATRGLIIVAHASAVANADSSGQLVQVTLDSGATSTASALAGINFACDPPLPRTRVLELCATLAAMPVIDTTPTVDFADINAAYLDNGWLDAGDEGIEAVIGLVGRHQLTVALRSENPPMPNALVGGAVGQGKSNLLLVLIHSLASRYAPTDLQMILLDLKDGVEFSRLGPDARGRHWLPHVMAMGLEFDIDFTLATLRWVVSEMADRASRMRLARVSKIGEFRKLESMPRLLVVIDEFQRLFEGDDNSTEEAAALLEQIARTGRSYGIHLILSSQTITGIRGLAAKSDAIFSQFHHRISMKNTASESSAILAPNNTAAAQLKSRGEVVANNSLGEPDANTIGFAAYADPNYLAECRRRMWVDSGSTTPPTIFRASALATWPTEATQARKSFAVGKAVSLRDTVRRVDLKRTVSQAVAILGSDELLASLVLRSGVRGMIPAIKRITILDGLGVTDPERTWARELLNELSENAVSVDIVARADIVRTVQELSTGVAANAPDLVIALALDSVTELEEPDPMTFETPTKALQRLFEICSTTGIHTVGWWNSRVRLEAQLGFNAPSIRAWCFCQATASDVQAICGPLVKAPRAYPRILYFDNNSSSVPETLVPFDSSRRS